ncbi:hypothetical protein C8R47DRAFT_1223396 [Mycena vitilis]|nr:hypothetical protein C8R47DRAFT_1223396 [Mycena vitilis]
MSDNLTNQTWEHTLRLPDAPVDDFNRELAGFTFESHGTGDDFEVEAFPPVHQLLDHIPASWAPNLPFVDFSTLPAITPDRHNGLTVMGPPPTPTPATRFTLRDLNAFPQVGPDYSPLTYPPHRPDDFRVAADRKRGLCDDETRARIGGSGATEKVKRPLGRPRKQKENASPTDESDAVPGRRHTYNGDDHVAIARVVVDMNPWIAQHGQKGVIWQRCVEKLLALGFRHNNINATTLQHKCEALISYKKDPQGKNKKLANILGDGKSAGILIAALLERMETQYDEAKDKGDDAKAKAQAKHDADKEGGEAIRRASMQTLRKRRRSPSPSDEDTDLEDITVMPPATSTRTAASADTTTSTTPVATPAPAATAPAAAAAAPAAAAAAPAAAAAAPAAAAPTPVSASSSIEIIDSDVEDDSKAAKKKPSKRRRLMDRRAASSSSGTDAIVSLLKEESTRRAAHEAEMAATFKTFVNDAREQKDEVTQMLKGLISLAERDL